MTDRLEAYRQAGVDLDLSNVASQIATDYCQQTWDNAGGVWHPQSVDTHLASSKRMPLDEIRKRPDLYGVGGTDGVGTKPELYERANDFYGLGSDLIAMAVDDGPVEGAEMVWVNNGMAVNRLSEETMVHVDSLFRGFRDAANEADTVLWTGEIAVHGDRVQGPTDFAVDWFGDAFGLAHGDRSITGARVEAGDVLYGFAEPDSFRCNGISRVRKTFYKAYGRQWEDQLYDGRPLSAWVAEGSTIYAGLMKVLTGGYRIEQPAAADIHGVAHISGGSLPEKLGRMLRVSGLGADVTNPFEFPKIMQHCQEVTEVKVGDKTRRMTDEEALTTWHGGQGYVVAASESDHDAIVQAGADKGIEVKPIGRVSKQPGLRVVSKGAYQYDDVLNFSL